MPGLGQPNKIGDQLELQSGSVLSDNVASFLNGQTSTSGRPKAYVSWVLFNEQLNYVASSSGFEEVPDESYYNNSTTPRVKVHEKFNLPIEKSGFLYIYTSNETPNIDVFFDNLQVTHFRGPLLEETHYYPFGLTMAGISSKALKANYPENQKKYNGIEHTTDFDLNTYDAFYRSLDPQTGRWWQIDPKIESMEMWSPYVSNYDNPITYADFLGDEPDPRGWAQKLLELTKDVAKKSVIFVAGAANAWSSNQVLGAGRVDVNEQSGLSYGDKLAAKAGQTLGDAASIITGAGEISAAGGGELATGGAATPLAVPLALHGASSIGMGFTNLIKGALDPVKQDKNSGGGTSSANSGSSSSSNSGKGNKLKPDKDAQGDHSTFQRDNNGNIYKYETYEKTKSGNFNPVKRYDGGTPDGGAGKPHFNKATQQYVPTPHVQGKSIPGGARAPWPWEIPTKLKL